MDALRAVASRRRVRRLQGQPVRRGCGTWPSLWQAAGIAAVWRPPLPRSGHRVWGCPDRSATPGARGQADPAGDRYLASVPVAASRRRRPSIRRRPAADGARRFGTRRHASAECRLGRRPARRPHPNGASGGRALAGGRHRPGAAGATWTIAAPDGGGTSRAYADAHPANAETVGQMMPVVPPAAAAAGGQRSATAFRAAVSSGTAGNIGAGGQASARGGAVARGSSGTEPSRIALGATRGRRRRVAGGSWCYVLHRD
jgi:hypothetical protein